MVTCAIIYKTDNNKYIYTYTHTHTHTDIYIYRENTSTCLIYDKYINTTAHMYKSKHTLMLSKNQFSFPSWHIWITTQYIVHNF